MCAYDPRWLTLSTYPVKCDITARVSDMDGYKHLNSIRIGQYYEEARATFYRRAFEGFAKLRTPVVEMTIQYLKEGFWPGTLQVGTGIAKIGNSSFQTVQALFQNGHCLGLCHTIVVNTSEGKSTPLPDDIRHALERMRVDTDAVAAY